MTLESSQLRESRQIKTQQYKSTQPSTHTVAQKGFEHLSDT